MAHELVKGKISAILQPVAAGISTIRPFSMFSTIFGKLSYPQVIHTLWEIPGREGGLKEVAVEPFRDQADPSPVRQWKH